ncbi:hypothetical protein N7522_000437 [Penicillium canescens]|uniref:Uncharacterized protein n=1 Tax=Penicillium canescens TaxID=5083 RepID=A0AAD6IAH9_PENCN|nr:uncharacterized protein N7446_012103 [Penicillium canescens]KAJ6019729.1 hypothetical protein N7522_000437 [Penicillium canescens]KAJ6038608.1 hypothetical protein N7460_007325 [Penicillium canescens]KAJ6047269.1 hypothetical protein N7446_012103 [Penicillium canescens]KAJ6060003.1 hypothetical protein N7444_002935 [Penicillium canescens]
MSDTVDTDFVSSKSLPSRALLNGSIPEVQSHSEKLHTLLPRANNRYWTLPPAKFGEPTLKMGSVLITAIVKSATEVVFEIVNGSVNQYGITFRETTTDIDAGSVEVASSSFGKFDPHGSIKPGDTLFLGFFNRG